MTENNLIELLNFLHKKDIITLDKESDIADLFDEMNKQKILSEHPYKISTREKNGELYYITHLRDETKKDNRKQITAKTLEQLESKIYQAYINEHTKTFLKVGKEWLINYRETVRESTFAKTTSEFNRFFFNSDFGNKNMNKIIDLDIEKFIHKEIKEKKLREKGYKSLKSLLNMIFKYALRHKYISSNPMETVKISTVNVYVPPKKKKEEIVFTTNEASLLKVTIKSDKDNYKDTAPLAILLAFQLGLRVGELIALKWDDICQNTIHVQRQEICYTHYSEDLSAKKTVHKIVEYTKTNAGDRILPLTPEANDILVQVKEFNSEHGITSDFIFSNKAGNNFNRQRINTCLYKYCTKAEIIKKSSHKVRRNVISTLLDNITNKESIRLFAGHEDLQTTLNSYYKDITDDDALYQTMCKAL